MTDISATAETTGAEVIIKVKPLTLMTTSGQVVQTSVNDRFHTIRGDVKKGLLKLIQIIHLIISIS